MTKRFGLFAQVNREAICGSRCHFPTHVILVAAGIIGSKTVPQSVLDAIKMGMWDYEPEEQDGSEFDATQALPGTHEKLAVLSERVSRGLPLWHPKDRQSYDETITD
jgi:hypothetical protein